MITIRKKTIQVGEEILVLDQIPPELKKDSDEIVNDIKSFFSLPDYIGIHITDKKIGIQWKLTVKSEDFENIDINLKNKINSFVEKITDVIKNK